MKTVVCALVLALLLTGCGTSKNSENKNFVVSTSPNKKVLQYENIKFKVVDVEFSGQIETDIYAELNFTDILNDLEIHYELSGQQIYIKNKGQKFTLDCGEELVLLDHSGEIICMFPLPGTNAFIYEMNGKELILDDNTISQILYEIGTPVNTDINYEKSSIEIETR